MLENIKSLVYILALAVPAFYLARRLVGSTISYREFAFCRNAWFAVTIAEFLSGNFWIFAVITAFVCIYARFAGAPTIALFFVLLFAVPLVDIEISGFGGINKLIEINNAGLLSIFLLLAILLPGRTGRQNSNAFATPDLLIVGYALLVTVLQTRNSEITNVLRTATTQLLNVLIPYFAVSRAVTSMAEFRKACIGIVIAVLPLSFVAVFEVVKVWHPYVVLVNTWGGTIMGSYNERSGMLRAFATAAGPIVLGYIFMVAIGCMLIVRREILSRNTEKIVWVMLFVGLFVTVSRGPWVGTAVLILVYVAAGSSSAATLAKLAAIGVVAVVALRMLPAGEQMLDLLPFFGSADEGTVEYRISLFNNALIVIERNLWLGSTDYRSTPELLQLMQGEGIVDIVNHYLFIALDSGLVGLSLFLSFFATILIKLRRVLKFSARQNSELNVDARAAMAILIGILVTIATASAIDFIPRVFWPFAGLCVALIRIAHQQRAAVVRASNVDRLAATGLL